MSSPELDKAVEIEIMTEDISAKSMFCCVLYLSKLVFSFTNR